MQMIERLRAHFSKTTLDDSVQATKPPKFTQALAGMDRAGLLQNVLWLSVPIYLGYAVWLIVLPSPMLRYQPLPVPAENIAALIEATGWFATSAPTTPSVAAVEPTLTVNPKITLQGVFVRAKLASVAIIAHDGITEVALQNQPTKSGYVLRQARPFEIELEDGSGQRFLVKMASQASLSELYQKSASPTPFVPNDVFVPNEALNLRPINPNIPPAGVVAMPPSFLPDIPPPSVATMPAAALSPAQNNLPLAQEVVTGETLPPEIGRLLYANPRYNSLSEDKKTQLRNLMAAPQFSESVRDNPEVLNQLIDSFPVDVGQ